MSILNKLYMLTTICIKLVITLLGKEYNMPCAVQGDNLSMLDKSFLLNMLYMYAVMQCFNYNMLF